MGDSGKIAYFLEIIFGNIKELLKNTMN